MRPRHVRAEGDDESDPGYNDEIAMSLSPRLDAPRNDKLIKSASCMLNSLVLPLFLDIPGDLTILCSILKIQAKVRGVRSAV